jgi:hypothetical protein
LCVKEILAHKNFSNCLRASNISVFFLLTTGGDCVFIRPLSKEYGPVGSKEMAAKGYYTNWFWFYYFFAQVCPLLRRT